VSKMWGLVSGHPRRFFDTSQRTLRLHGVRRRSPCLVRHPRLFWLDTHKNDASIQRKEAMIPFRGVGASAATIKLRHDQEYRSFVRFDLREGR